MQGNLALWGRISDAARFYKRLARRSNNKYKASILSLAAEALEDLGEDVANGYIRRSTAEKVEYVLGLLKRNYLPYITMERAYHDAVRSIPVRQTLVYIAYMDDVAVIGI